MMPIQPMMVEIINGEECCWHIWQFGVVMFGTINEDRVIPVGSFESMAELRDELPRMMPKLVSIE